MEIDLVMGIKWYLVFLFSTTLHEAAHAWAALKLGDNTAYLGGQVSLDPTPHLRRSPVGLFVVPIVSYLLGGWMIGWAKTPYQVAWALENPRRAAWMALAGPSANLLLVILSAILLVAGVKAHYFQVSEHPQWAEVVTADSGWGTFWASMLSLTFMLNLLLCLFNLLPLPPLDGSQLPLLVLPASLASAYFRFIHQPNFIYIGMFAAWKLCGLILPPVQKAVLHQLFILMG